jgi:nitrogen permease regulator 2-like protein
VCVGRHTKIVGYPVCIEDDKYFRNALLFNIGFVFDEHVETAPFLPILRKLGTLVESMEKESGFLSKPERKQLLAHILPQILGDLTLHGECTIPVDTANIINLKLFPKLHDPSQVFDYQVPVAVRDLRQLLENSGGRRDVSVLRRGVVLIGVLCG